MFVEVSPSGLVACGFCSVYWHLYFAYTHTHKKREEEEVFLYISRRLWAYGVNISTEYLKPLIEPASYLLIPRCRTDSRLCCWMFMIFAAIDTHVFFSSCVCVCVHHARMPLSPIQQHNNNKNTQMPITLYNLSFRTHSNVQKKKTENENFNAQSPD